MFCFGLVEWTMVNSALVQHLNEVVWVSVWFSLGTDLKACEAKGQQPIRCYFGGVLVVVEGAYGAGKGKFALCMDFRFYFMD